MNTDDLNHALGIHLMRLDCIESKAHEARGKGLYVAPGSSEPIAMNVCLELAAVAIDRKWWPK